MINWIEDILIGKCEDMVKDIHISAFVYKHLRMHTICQPARF